MKKISYIALIVAMMAGCVKQEYTASTLHPGTCWLTLYTNSISDNAVTFIDGDLNASYIDSLIAPAVYTFTAYSPTDDLEDYVAPTTSSSDITIPIYLKAVDGVVPPNIDNIYYGTKTTKLEGDTDRPISLAPLFASRNLTINLVVGSGDPSLITEISSTLTGLSQGWCLYNDEPIGDIVSTNPVFVVDGSTLTADIRLLGVNTTTTQILTTTLKYQNGETATFEDDITDIILKINGTLDRIIYGGEVTAPEN